MGKRRMLSREVCESDDFLDMPHSAQNLYLHLTLNADDDGFLNNARTIMRMLGSCADDMKVLIAKGYLIVFDSGVVVITHWFVNNQIPKDRHHATEFAERSQVTLTADKVYTRCIQDVYNTDTGCIPKLSKVNLSKPNSSEVVVVDNTLLGAFHNIRLTELQQQQLREHLGDYYELYVERVSVFRHDRPDTATYSDAATIMKFYDDDKERGRLPELKEDDSQQWEDFFTMSANRVHNS